VEYEKLPHIPNYVAAVPKKGGEHHVPPEERIATFDNDDTLRQEAACYHAGKREQQRSLYACLVLPHPDPYRILEIQFIEV
jgi:hypothetical protein